MEKQQLSKPSLTLEEKEQKTKNRQNMLFKLLKSKREKDADQTLEEEIQNNQELISGFRHNKFGAFCLQAGDLARAEEHLLKAKEIIQKAYLFTNVEMNLGNLEAQKKNYKKAIEYYQKVIENSPHKNPKDFGADKQVIFSKQLNSFTAYVDAYTNLAVMYVQLDQFEKGFQFCKKSLELKPEDSQSLVNYTDILRQLGKKDEAIKHSWDQITEYTKKKVNPDYEGFKAIEIKPWKLEEKKFEEDEKHISVLCVKWGTRYNADYVNKLYAGIKRNTSWKITFYCFTDDEKDLHEDIKVEKLEEGWKKWWGKVTLFNCGIQGRKFYIDLDMIITGNLDQLFEYDGEFATLRTGDLFCQKNHKDGYNSSVMIWKDDYLRPVYDALRQNFQSINKFIVRFDFWLEMTINHADYLQVLYPGKVIDFLADAKELLPQGSSVVCFARKPKPEDFPAPWVKEYWVL